MKILFKTTLKVKKKKKKKIYFKLLIKSTL